MMKLYILILAMLVFTALVIADLTSNNEEDISTGISEDVTIVSEYHNCKDEVIRNVTKETKLYSTQRIAFDIWERKYDNCFDLKKLRDRNELSVSNTPINYPKDCDAHLTSRPPTITAVDNSLILDELISACKGLSTNAGISNEEANDIISASSIGAFG